jgi:hypothetical protein
MRKIKNKSRKSNRSTDGGHKWSIPPQPPQITFVPWYNLTLRIDNPPSLTTTATIQAALANQLNVTFDNSFCFIRLQRVRLWGQLLNDATLPPVNVIIYDPIQTSAQSASIGLVRILEQYIDFPDQVNRARIGYIYPKAQREASLRLANTNPSQLIFASGMGTGSVMYINLQWRSFNGSVSLSSDSLQDLELGESLERASDQYARESLVRDKHGVITNLVPSYFNRK